MVMTMEDISEINKKKLMENIIYRSRKNSKCVSYESENDFQRMNASNSLGDNNELYEDDLDHINYERNADKRYMQVCAFSIN